MSPARRTQAERRAETRSAVLESACRIFGSKGYQDTSLEEIAAASGTTIRPIYHYFGSKQELFAAVNEIMEERILVTLQEPDADRGLSAWRAFLELCRDAEFRRVVLVDGPAVLGRERWATSAVTRAVSERLRRHGSDLAARMLMGALAEAALAVAEHDDPERLGREAETLVVRLAAALAPDAEEERS